MPSFDVRPEEVKSWCVAIADCPTLAPLVGGTRRRIVEVAPAQAAVAVEAELRLVGLLDGS